MDLSMSALTLCTYFINYDRLIITIVLGPKTLFILIFSCDIDFVWDL